jgi:hypothetical protein
MLSQTCSAKAQSLSCDLPLKLLRVEIVDKFDIIYQKGRNLAEQMYQKVWQTDRLIDNNDYGVVIFYDDSVIANVNIQLKQQNSLLKSEQFFCVKHWQKYLKIADSQIAEISGLAISDRLPNSFSRPVLMTLVLGLRTLLSALELRAYTTIQHKFLIRLLTKSLKLPFFINEIVTSPQIDVPDDNYWKREESPRIYYLDGFDPQAIRACNLFLYSLNLVGIETSFFNKKGGHCPP